jgi:hypothetical protein
MADAYRNSAVEQFLDREIYSTGSRRQRRAWRCEAIASALRMGATTVATAPQFRGRSLLIPVPLQIAPVKTRGPELAPRASRNDFLLYQRHFAISKKAASRLMESLFRDSPKAPP